MGVFARMRQTLKLAGCASRTVQWQETGNPVVPLSADVNGQHWELAVNDFPDNSLYELRIDGIAVGSFSDWPSSWTAVHVPVSVGVHG